MAKYPMAEIASTQDRNQTYHQGGEGEKIKPTTPPDENNV